MLVQVLFCIQLNTINQSLRNFWSNHDSMEVSFKNLITVDYTKEIGQNYKVKIIDGRDFSEDFKSDTSAILLNKAEEIFQKYNSAYPFQYAFADVEFQKKLRQSAWSATSLSIHNLHHLRRIAESGCHSFGRNGVKFRKFLLA